MEFFIKINKTTSLHVKIFIKSNYTFTLDDIIRLYIPCNTFFNVPGRIFSLKAYINICNMQMEWNTLTRRQRKGLKLMYRQGCTCNIKYNPWKKVKKEKDTCQWKNKCEEEEVGYNELLFIDYFIFFSQKLLFLTPLI